MDICLIYKMLLSVLAALACCSCHNDFERPPYPGDLGDGIYMDVDLAGRVVYIIDVKDADGNWNQERIPIPNISVALDNPAAEKYFMRTNSNGVFFIEAKDVNIGERPNFRISLYVSDTDGVDGGGKFIGRTISRRVDVLIEPLKVNLFDIVLGRDYSVAEEFLAR